MSLFFLFLILLLAVPRLSQGDEYFVAVWGDDSAVGDCEHPLRSLSHAAEIAFGGDTVSVFAGVYYESVTILNSGTASFPVIFRGYPGDDVTLKAQSSNGFFIGDSIEYIVIQNFNLTLAYPVGEPHGAGVRILGNYCSVLDNHIYDCHMGVFIETFTTGTSISNHHNTVFGNIFSDIGEAAVRIKRSDNNSVINNLFYHNGYTIEPAGALTYYGIDGISVFNNTFWDNCGPAIHNYNGTNQAEIPITTNALVVNNVSARNNGGILFRIDSSMTTETSNLYHHNLWYNGEPGSKIVEWGYNNLNQGGEALTFIEYLEVVSRLNSMNGLGSLEADPLFHNANNLDFDLLSGSPAIDGGAMDLASLGLEGLTATFDQIPDDGIPDLGFHHLPGIFWANPMVVREGSVKVFPNPSNGLVHIAIQLPNLRYFFLPSVEIYNILGQRVDGFRAEQDDKNDYFIIDWNPAEAIASGIYFAVIKTERENEACRIVIQR